MVGSTTGVFVKPIKAFDAPYIDYQYEARGRLGKAKIKTSMNNQIDGTSEVHLCLLLKRRYS